MAGFWSSPSLELCTSSGEGERGLVLFELSLSLLSPASEGPCVSWSARRQAEGWLACPPCTASASSSVDELMVSTSGAGPA